jgi:hypothetical protein
MDSSEFFKEDWSSQISRSLPSTADGQLTFTDRLYLIWPLTVALNVASDLDFGLELAFENVNLG